jgi:tRNA pseudouridine55 synthase
MDKKLMAMNGVFAVFKPAGETSARTIDKLKTTIIRQALGPAASNNQIFKRLSRQIKVGHGGTLDPMATGVLVIGLNAGCKELGKYLTGSKSYVAEARFGEHYDTLDRTGKLLQSDEGWMEAVKEVTEIIPKFVGEAVMQVPPAFSAIHVNGKRAYEIARKESEIESGASTEITSETIESKSGSVDSSDIPDSSDSKVVQPQKEASFDIPPRPVAIHSITYTPLSLPTFRLSVSCGGGCYIRSLIRDIAAEVGTLAHMTELERVKQGIFTTDMCLREWDDLDKIEEAIKKAKELI